ncbi:hypothetical protein HBI12_047160 [Parastagonospora nodorum]|nr:hypothetical protein HBI12_047160 [Parastagonospora nodorum]KAH5437900.1 hypothetical protein HBI47_059340 [Parastagonospora nodorum]
MASAYKSSTSYDTVEIKAKCTCEGMSGLFPAKAPLITGDSAKCICQVMQYVFSGRSVTLIRAMEWWHSSNRGNCKPTSAARKAKDGSRV